MANDFLTRSFPKINKDSHPPFFDKMLFSWHQELWRALSWGMLERAIERALLEGPSSVPISLRPLPEHTRPSFQNFKTCPWTALTESSHLSFKHVSHPEVGW